MDSFQKKLDRYLDARQPILLIDTFEDDKVEEVIEKLAKRRRRSIQKWSRQGFKGRRSELKDIPILNSERPLSVNTEENLCRQRFSV